MRLVTSNAKKLAEFRRFGLPGLEMALGLDLPEVASNDAATVVLYKALAAGEGHLVEDTSLIVEGVQVGTDVRWLLAELPRFAGHRAVWAVYVAHHDGAAVRIAAGFTPGRLAAPPLEPGEAFGFDPIFVPDGSPWSLAQLEAAGQKDLFSARKSAIERLLAKSLLVERAVTDIAPWSGAYQGDNHG